MSSDDDFDWENDPSVILNDQAAVAARRNDRGELEILQRDSLGASATLYISPENIEQFLKGLSDRAAQPELISSLVPASTRLVLVKGGAD